MFTNEYLINKKYSKWFERCHEWTHEAERAERLGLAWEQEDKILKVTYHSLNELDLKAEEMRVKYKEELQQYKEMLKSRGAK